MLVFVAALCLSLLRCPRGFCYSLANGAIVADRALLTATATTNTTTISISISLSFGLSFGLGLGSGRYGCRCESGRGR